MNNNVITWDWKGMNMHIFLFKQSCSAFSLIVVLFYYRASETLKIIFFLPKAVRHLSSLEKGTFKRKLKRLLRPCHLFIQPSTRLEDANVHASWLIIKDSDVVALFVTSSIPTSHYLFNFNLAQISKAIKTKWLRHILKCKRKVVYFHSAPASASTCLFHSWHSHPTLISRWIGFCPFDSLEISGQLR